MWVERLTVATVCAAGAAALLTSACAGAARNPVLDQYPPGVIGHTTVVYYDVHGSTFVELRTDMRARGPKVNGASFVGETRAPMAWTWKTTALGRSNCTIREVSVRVNAEITLPRWTPPADTEPGLLAEWNRFLEALEAHEAGHKDISARSGKAIIDQIRGLSGTCVQINARANEIARAIVERSGREQIAYDATTRHGLTQGTGFGSGRSNSSTLDLGAGPPTSLVTPRPGTVRGPIPTALEQAWMALPAAYASLGLTMTVIDSATHVAGQALTVRTTVGGSLAVSDAVECDTPLTGPDADSVDVALFVTSRLESSGPAESVVTNTMQATARTAGGQPTSCRSRGLVEQRLLEALRQSAGR